jgi:hypothetical protein
MNNYPAKCPIWGKFGVINRHIMLLIICEFREDWGKEGVTFHASVNLITYTRVH